MSKRLIVLFAVGAVLVSVIAIAAVVTNQKTVGAQRSSPMATRSHATRTPVATQAQAVTAALAKLASEPASLVSSGASPEALAGARTAVPAGSKVSVAESSWAPDGVGGGTVMVTVSPPQGGPVTYAAVMVHEPSGWKVLATIPLASSTPISGSDSTP